MKNTKNNYYVIGGQYFYMCYGTAKTILGAKRLAGKHGEYWENWHAWHRPSVYRAEDCIENGGYIYPASGVSPVCSYNYMTGKWD